jgi:DNA-binding PadR family transcriptional regulator
MGEELNRELVRGSLPLMVLSVLATGPKYGYLIQKEVKEASGGGIGLAAGTLYPLLHRLEADKLIACRWETAGGRKRKWYSLTAAGKKRLANQAQQWREYAHCLSALLAGGNA